MDPVAQMRKKSLADSYSHAAMADSFRKLDPRTMVKNPVILVVEVGAVLTTVELGWNASSTQDNSVLACKLRFGCGLRCSLPTSQKPWPKAGQGASRYAAKARAETQAHRLRSDGSTEMVGFETTLGDIVVVAAGDFIPGDGEVIEGVGSVEIGNYRRVAPVIRESGGNAPQSPVEHAYFPMRSRCGSLRILAKPFWTG